MNAAINVKQKNSRLHHLAGAAKNRFQTMKAHFQNWRVTLCKPSSSIDKETDKNLTSEQRKCLKEYTITKAEIVGIGFAGFMGGAAIGAIVGGVGGVFAGACSATVVGMGIGAAVGAVVGAGVGGAIGAFSKLADEHLYETPVERARTKKDLYTRQVELTKDKIENYKEATAEAKGWLPPRCAGQDKHELYKTMQIMKANNDYKSENIKRYLYNLERQSQAEELLRQTQKQIENIQRDIAILESIPSKKTQES